MRTGSRGGPSRGPARVACRAARTRRWRFSGAFPCTERRLRASLGTCRERPLGLCANEWRSGIRRTPQVACSACDHRELVPLSDAVLDRHLTGQCTVGVYLLFTDESCGGLRPISMRRNGARTRAPSSPPARPWMCRWPWRYPAPGRARMPGSSSRRRCRCKTRGTHLGAALIRNACAHTGPLKVNSYHRPFPHQDTLLKRRLRQPDRASLAEGPACARYYGVCG